VRASSAVPLILLLSFAARGGTEDAPRRGRWAFERPRAVVPPGLTEPGARNPIDLFLLERLHKDGLRFRGEADRATLLRRLSFDLLGLPPEPEDLDAFAADPRPDACERWVDRLLASPRHGERWGRHWLDVVRFSESHGFEYDRPRDHAWPYRDYVIDSFNRDSGYDRFIVEQIAGDVLEPPAREGIAATGFLVCGAYDQAGNLQANRTQRLIGREEEIEDLIATVSQTFLGLTVNCARCHAHKFDPIPQEDYYRLHAVFAGVFHGERPLETPVETTARERRIVALDAALAGLMRQIAAIDAESQGEAPSRGARAEREALLAKLAAARAERETLAAPPLVYAGTRREPEPTRVLARGDVTQPGELVPPGTLAALAGDGAGLGLDAAAPEGQRRLALARWMASSANPLAARVAMNRLWHYHFGKGIVGTPSDFGAGGEAPSHAELLDWLALWLEDHGWSLKRAHLLIAGSAAYRQASDFDERAAAIDADARLLWRFPPRRLEAEAVRDALLAAAGRLDLGIGGPSFRPFRISTFNSTFYEIEDREGPDFERRSVYRMNVVSGKDPILDVLDCPDPAARAPERRRTTTPLQALSMMNNSFVLRQARALAERALREGSDALEIAIDRAFRLALGRPPAPSEAARGLALAREHGIESLAWVLVNAAEFQHVR
jgi:hypothetical protein